MWTKEIYKKALEEYREFERGLQETYALSWEELYEKYRGYNDYIGFDVDYKSITITIDEREDGLRFISEGVEIYGDEWSCKCELLSLEELIRKANL